MEFLIDNQAVVIIILLPLAVYGLIEWLDTLDDNNN